MLAMLTVSQELSKSLQSETGKLYAIKCDVSKNSDIEMAFKWVKDNLGGVDILVNNAVVGLPTSLIGKTPRQLLIMLMVWFLGDLDKAKCDILVSSSASVRPNSTTRLQLDGFS
jgi:NAD(P)-dependent dehydrogenase (short-subunit alcohol dehydrogenase family)